MAAKWTAARPAQYRVGSWGRGIEPYDTGWAGDGIKCRVGCIALAILASSVRYSISFATSCVPTHPVDLEICAKALSLYPSGRVRAGMGAGCEPTESQH